MDIRELPKILLKEFGKNIVRKQARDIYANKGECWEAQLCEGVGLMVYDNIPGRDQYLKMWRERDSGTEDGVLHRPAFAELYVGPEHLCYDPEKGNIYRDKITVGWPSQRTDLASEPYISLWCKIIIRAQELISGGSFEFPTYYVSAESPDGLRIPIDYKFSWSE